MTITHSLLIKPVHKPLTWLVIASALVTVFCVVVMYAQYRSVLDSAAQSDIQHRLFRSDKQTAFLSMQENSFLQTNYPMFQKIVQGYQGSNAALRKVQWVRLLETAKTQVGISAMSFDVYPYQAVVSSRQEFKVQVGVEKIVLNLSLLHDGKLADLIKYLEDHAPNVFVVTAVSIERVDESTTNGFTDREEIRLKAELTIQWYLIEVAGADDAIAS